MIGFDIKISGADQVTAAMRRTAAQGQKRVAAATYHWAVNALPRMRAMPYPPERPGQKYKRTGLLRRSWHADPTPDGARIYNDRPGVVFVIGDWMGGGQAWMHIGRWWTAEGVLRNERQKLRPLLVKELDHLLSMGQIRP